MNLERETHMYNPGPLPPKQLAPGLPPSSGLLIPMHRAVAIAPQERRGGAGIHSYCWERSLLSYLNSIRDYLRVRPDSKF